MCRCFFWAIQIGKHKAVVKNNKIKSEKIVENTEFRLQSRKTEAEIANYIFGSQIPKFVPQVCITDFFYPSRVSTLC